MARTDYSCSQKEKKRERDKIDHLLSDLCYSTLQNAQKVKTFGYDRVCVQIKHEQTRQET